MVNSVSDTIHTSEAQQQQNTEMSTTESSAQWSWNTYRERSKLARRTTFSNFQIFKYTRSFLSKWAHKHLNLYSAVKFIFCRFTIIELAMSYRIGFLKDDLLAGVSTSFLHLAQGLAYGDLSGLTGANGLYTSFLAPAFYAVFGTSKHLSIGTFAVVSLLTKQAVDNAIVEIHREMNIPDVTVESLLNDMDLRMQVAMTLCLTMGIVLLILAIFRIGAIVVLFTKALVSGYICAAAFFVFTSQVSPALGFTLTKSSTITGDFGVFFIKWYNILNNVKNSNLVTTAITFACIVVLAVGRWLNQRYIRFIRVSLPLEVACIAVSCVIGQTTLLYHKHNITLIGSLPSGLVAPQAPQLKFVRHVFQDAIALAFVTMTINFAVALQYAEKYNYLVSTDQDLFAYSIINIFSSFFKCIPACASLSRTAIAAANFQRTQLSAIVSSIILLIILYTLTEYLSVIPLCVLSGVVIYNIFGSIRRVTDLKTYWTIDLLEGAVWSASFILTLLFDVDLGLVFALIFSLALNTVFLIKPRFQTLGILQNNVSGSSSSSVYVDRKLFPESKRPNCSMALIKLNAPLLSYNVDGFKSHVFKLMALEKVHHSPGIAKILLKLFTGTEDEHIELQMDELSQELDFNRGNIRHEIDLSLETNVMTYNENEQCSPAPPYCDNSVTESYYQANMSSANSGPKHCILECDRMSSIDSVGIKTLRELKTRISGQHKDGRLIFVQINADVIASVDAEGSFDFLFGDNSLFLTISDAVQFLSTCN